MATLTLKQLMNGRTPNPDFSGVEVADDLVLAVNLNQSTKVDDFIVAQFGVKGITSSLNAETQDTQYIRQGKSTVKTGFQRTIEISGDRFVGDFFQDKCMETIFEVGQAVVTEYVYFNILTGKGERGTVSIVVEQDKGGNAGETSEIQISFKSVGVKPTPYTYTPNAQVLKTFDGIQEGEK